MDNNSSAAAAAPSSTARANGYAAASVARSTPPTVPVILSPGGSQPRPNGPVSTTGPSTSNGPLFTAGASTSTAAANSGGFPGGSSATNVGGGPGGAAAAANLAAEMNDVTRLILELRDQSKRANALSELAKKRGLYQQMAPLIWYSFGTVAILMQEVIAAYPFMAPPPEISPDIAVRACNALVLFQAVASHPEIKNLFAQAWIPFFLYTFIEATSTAPTYEHLRLFALAVIGALVKNSDTAIINLILSSEIMPMCLHAMEIGSELSRTTSAYVFEAILRNDSGLNYICQLPERLISTNHALENVVLWLVQNPSMRLLKLIVLCYLRISMNELGRSALNGTLPRALVDGTFARFIAGNPEVRSLLQQLLENVIHPIF